MKLGERARRRGAREDGQSGGRNLPLSTGRSLPALRPNRGRLPYDRRRGPEAFGPSGLRQVRGYQGVAEASNPAERSEVAAANLRGQEDRAPAVTPSLRIGVFEPNSDTGSDSCDLNPSRDPTSADEWEGRQRLHLSCTSRASGCAALPTPYQRVSLSR